MNNGEDATNVNEKLGLYPFRRQASDLVCCTDTVNTRPFYYNGTKDTQSMIDR